MLAIIGSRSEEISLLRSRSRIDAIENVERIRFYLGEINDTRILLADASAVEKGIVAAGGIGIDRFGADTVIFTGVAAPLVPYLQHGDMVVADKLMQIGGRPETIPDEPQPDEEMSMIYADTGLIQQVCQAYESLFSGKSNRPELVKGTVVSVDSDVFDRKSSGRLQREYGAIAVNKDGASAARLCMMKRKPFLVMCTIADPPAPTGRAPFDSHLSAFPPHMVDVLEAALTTARVEPAIR